jgi:antiviral defense system Shedu protein SduA
MTADPISTTSVARGVAYTDPIVLREGPVSRLVFLPTLLDREHPLRGSFVYQRKSRLDDWEDVRGLSLGHLKAGEGYVLELHSAEVSLLLQGLLERRDVYEKHGVEYGTHEYVSRDNLPQIVRGIIDFPESELADVLRELDEEDVLSFGHKVDVSKLDSALMEWRNNSGNGDEDFWQDLLSRNAWVFSHVTGSPVVVVQEKAYVGGKSIANVGGGQVDYLCRNELTGERLAGRDQDASHAGLRT